jgi:hypothetical protein
MWSGWLHNPFSSGDLDADFFCFHEIFLWWVAVLPANKFRLLPILSTKTVEKARSPQNQSGSTVLAFFTRERSSKGLLFTLLFFFLLLFLLLLLG